MHVCSGCFARMHPLRTTPDGWNAAEGRRSCLQRCTAVRPAIAHDDGDLAPRRQHPAVATGAADRGHRGPRGRAVALLRLPAQGAGGGRRGHRGCGHRGPCRLPGCGGGASCPVGRSAATRLAGRGVGGRDRGVAGDHRRVLGPIAAGRGQRRLRSGPAGAPARDRHRRVGRRGVLGQHRADRGSGAAVREDERAERPTAGRLVPHRDARVRLRRRIPRWLTVTGRGFGPSS